MRFDVMTLFPGLVSDICATSVVGSAIEAGVISVVTHNIRDYSDDRRHRVDDTPYGGGKGMLMAAPPVVACFEAVRAMSDAATRTVYMSPAGAVLDQKKAKELLKYDRIVILCGHYEGIDERAVKAVADEEISIGDYVLTGGELPACVLIDCVSRLVPGVLAAEECHENESISCGMVEWPQYTRPEVFRGEKVPDVLLSGDHAKIEAWRRKTALERTKKKRPDLL